MSTPPVTAEAIERLLTDVEAAVTWDAWTSCVSRIELALRAYRDLVREQASRPRVVCLCGSTRFRPEFEAAARAEGLAGRITLTVACFGHAGDLPPEACIDGHPVKTMLDDLHKRKIDLADEVLVINVGGYVGTSTRSEIAYAEAAGKMVRYLEPRGVRRCQYCGETEPCRDHAGWMS